MGFARNAAVAAMAAVAAVALAACGGGSGGGGKGAGHKEPAASGTPAAPLTKLAVPSGFDVSKGWEQVLAWMPDNARTTPVADAPRSEAVAYLDSSEDGYVPTLRDVRTGKVRWRGQPWQPPDAVEDVVGDGVDIPDVVVATQGGHDYVVAWAHGTTGKDGLEKGHEVVEAVVYPAEAHGGLVAPARKFTVMLPDDGIGAHGDVTVRDGGGAGLLVTWNKDAQGAAVDLATGRVRLLSDASKTKTGCVDTCIPDSAYAAVATAGAVIARGEGGFGVDDRWYSRDVRPSGVPATHDGAQNGKVEGSAAGDLVAQWSPHADGPDGDPVWAVHDAATGKVRAAVACATSTPGQDAGARLSPDGHYLVFDTMAFDLTTGKGRCFAESGARQAVHFVSVGDDGTAYGTTGRQQADGGTPVVVSLTTGFAVPLTKGLELPVAVYGDRGVFATADVAGAAGARRIVVYART